MPTQNGDTRLALCDIRGLLDDLFDKLTGENWSEWFTALKKFLRKENPWKTAKAARVNILQYISRFKVSGTDKFIAADNFKVDNSAGVKFYEFGPNLEKYFLGKVENNVPAGFLKSYRLKQGSVDGPIKSELGKYEETFLSDFFEQLKRQATGQTGRLEVDGKENIFYIRDVGGTVWAVNASWYGYGSGWYVLADSVERTFPLEAGSLVFTR